jgi:hypothetical protein
MIVRMGSTGPRSRAHWLWTAGAALACLGLVVLGLATPSPDGTGTHVQFGLPPCAAMALFGLPCPGCGVTTSMALAADGRFADSLANQPLGFALAASAAVFILWALWAQVSGRDLHGDMRRLNRRWAYVTLAVVLVGAWTFKLWKTLA